MLQAWGYTADDERIQTQVRLTPLCMLRSLDSISWII